MDKVYLRLRHPRSFDVRAGEAGAFDALRGHKYALLVTFRRDGTPVPTPVWFGIGADGNVYVESFVEAGKLKRLRNDPRAVLAPCTVRGKPVGPATAFWILLFGIPWYVKCQNALNTYWASKGAPEPTGWTA